MAPNRKNTFSLAETLANGNLTGLYESISPKYLPLTHHAEAAQESAVDNDAKDICESASYWDWPGDVQNEPIDLFSGAHIEDNLKKAAAKFNKETDKDDAAENHSKEVPKRQLGTYYWDWPAVENLKEATINRVLEEERVRQIVSGAVIDAIVRRGATSDYKTNWAVNPANDDFWNWTSDDSDGVWDPLDGIQALIDYEVTRELLSGKNIEKHLRQWKVPESCAVHPPLDDYWIWSQTSC